MTNLDRLYEDVEFDVKSEQQNEFHGADENECTKSTGVDLIKVANILKQKIPARLVMTDKQGLVTEIPTLYTPEDSYIHFLWSARMCLTTVHFRWFF